MDNKFSQRDPIYWLHCVNGIDIRTAQKIALLIDIGGYNEVSETYPDLWKKIQDSYESRIEFILDC